jgi:hypothetical protein
MINLFWPVYKNLEHEVVELSNKIHFDDKQLSVYSVKISELLIRCAVEIEAISKELYFQIGGVQPTDRDIFFDTDCINLLENKWQLSKKKVIASSVDFYFLTEENQVLTPLKKANKRGTSGSDWKQSYQAVKHDRTGNLQKGNLKNLLRAMAALFILNLYYRNETIDLADKNSDTFADGFSDIFNIKVHKWRGSQPGKDPYIKHTDFDECTYLIKWADDHHLRHEQYAVENNKLLNGLLFKHPKVVDYMNNHIIEHGEINQAKMAAFIENREVFNIIDMKNEYGLMIREADKKASEITKFNWKNPVKYEAVFE